MSLSDLVIETQEITVGSGVSFTVRGLCFNDLTQLIRLYGEDLDKIIQSFNGADFSEKQDAELLSYALNEVPEVVATAIALAAGEIDQADKVKLMNVAVQLEAIKSIWTLTIDGSGGLKKLVGSLMETIAIVKRDVATLQSTGMS